MSAESREEIPDSPERSELPSCWSSPFWRAGCFVFFVFVAIVIRACTTTPSPHVVEHSLGPQGPTIIATFKPAHAFLAEYFCSLSVRFANGKTSDVELRMDSGGKSRAQIYQLPDGSYFYDSHVGTVHIEVAKSQISAPGGHEFTDIPPGSKYLGAIDNSNEGFRFFTPSESPQQKRDMSPDGLYFLRPERNPAKSSQ